MTSDDMFYILFHTDFGLLYVYYVCGTSQCRLPGAP